MTTRLPSYKRKKPNKPETKTASWTANPNSKRDRVKQTILEVINKSEVKNNATELTLASVDLEEATDRVMDILK